METEYVDDGKQYSYIIHGTNITSNDFIGLTSLEGIFTVIDNKSSLTLNVNQDFINEDNETFTLSLKNGQASVDVSIKDTSVPLIPYYNLTVNKYLVNEGGSVTITLHTENVSYNS